MIENVNLTVNDVFGAQGINYQSLMSQEQCVTLINQLQQSYSISGWIMLILAGLVVLLSLLLILQQMKIKELNIKNKKGKVRR